MNQKEKTLQFVKSKKIKVMKNKIVPFFFTDQEIYLLAL